MKTTAMAREHVATPTLPTAQGVHSYIKQCILFFTMKYNGPGNPVLFYIGIVIDALWVTIYSIPSMLASIFYCIFPRPCKKVKGEIILVTGAGQGLGRELCLTFARLGAELICVDLAADTNQETVKLIRETGGVARGYVCDVSDRTAIHKLAQEVGRVDILINNAGIYPVKGLWNSSENEIRTIININLMSQLWTAQAFLPGMKKRNHGHFVSIASLAGLCGLTYMEPYAVSKAGLTGLIYSLQHEVRTEKKNVKISIAYPYFVKTRTEIRECCEARFPPLEIDDAVKDIVQGIRQELFSFTVPGHFRHTVNLTNMYPDTYWNKWFEIFYAKINEPKEDEFKNALDSGLLNQNTGNIQIQT